MLPIYLCHTVKVYAAQAPDTPVSQITWNMNAPVAKSQEASLEAPSYHVKTGQVSVIIILKQCNAVAIRQLVFL